MDTTSDAVGTEPPERLSADDRRERLLDLTREIVNDEGPAAVTMGVVAERAGVTRALVYKHFDNKDDLLVALYRREANALDRRIRTQVEAAPEAFEPKVRAFIGACLDAVGEHDAFFSPLRDLRGAPSARRDQRRWDRRTMGYFAGLAADEFDISEDAARAALGVLFTGIQALLLQLRRRPGAERRQFLEDTYVDVTIGALERLASH